VKQFRRGLVFEAQTQLASKSLRRTCVQEPLATAIYFFCEYEAPTRAVTTAVCSFCEHEVPTRSVVPTRAVSNSH
jgi:hypothetical protein